MRPATSILLMLALGLLSAEVAARGALAWLLPVHERARRTLLGAEADWRAGSAAITGQPYLLYRLEPDAAHGHNVDGYRGPAIPRRRSDVPRVLFLGGSTTYGVGVEAGEALPAAVGEALAAAGRPVEVINGGVPYGTSAEMLTHYLFKYRYYRPDVVVLHTGANDPHAFYREGYLPDYAHWRAQPHEVLPLPGETAWVLRSRLVALVVVELLFHGRLQAPRFVHPSPPHVPWYDPQDGLPLREGDPLPEGYRVGPVLVGRPGALPFSILREGEERALEVRHGADGATLEVVGEAPQAVREALEDAVGAWARRARWPLLGRAPVAVDEVAFARNLDTLLDAVRRDGGVPLLVREHHRPREGAPVVDVDVAHDEALVMLAREHGVTLTGLPEGALLAGHFQDEIHLVPEGERIEATFLAPILARLLPAPAP